MKNKYVASCSFGKDSLAMVLNLIERNAPLDEVIFYDTGMEFDSIYRNRDKLIPILAQRGIQFTELKPDNPFLYDMLERPVFSKQKGNHFGYGWCGGVCRWGTTWKTKAIDTYVEGAKVHYIGIAADEPERLNRLVLPKNAPLFVWGMTERDALQYCYEHGWNWLEHTHTHTQEIELYSILDRVSCWCCANKNRKELYNIYRYLPEYWNRLKDLQAQIERPMKKFSNKQYGEYGNLFQLEKVFEAESIKGG